MSTPSSLIVPDVGATSRSTQCATVDLPLPDSPTSPRISPGPSEKLTPSTACTIALLRENGPPPL